LPSLQYCASICQTSVENNTVVTADDGPLSFCTMYLLNKWVNECIKITYFNSKCFLCLGYMKTWSSPRINSRVSVVHNIYINYLPLKINSVLEPILFADNTSVIISSRFFEDLYSVYRLVLSCMIKWFIANNLVLNWDKMNIMKFISENSAHCTLHLGYKKRYIEQTVNTKFLGFQINNT